MKNRYTDGPLNLRRDLVHRICADDDEIRARDFEILRGLREDHSALIPSPIRLQFLNLRKVHAV